MLDQTDTLYFPKARPDWDRVSPQQAGSDPAGLQAAVDQAGEIESLWSRDLDRPLDDMMHEPSPYNEKIGPLKARGNETPQSGTGRQGKCRLPATVRMAI